MFSEVLTVRKCKSELHLALLSNGRLEGKHAIGGEVGLKPI